MAGDINRFCIPSYWTNDVDTDSYFGWGHGMRHFGYEMHMTQDVKGQSHPYKHQLTISRQNNILAESYGDVIGSIT